MATLLAHVRVPNWRRYLTLRLMLVCGVIIGTLGVGGLLALRSLRPAAPVATLPGQTLAWTIAQSAGRSPGVQIASGAYIPGNALVLYTRTEQTDRARIRTWALLQLEPFADQFATMPASEKLTWVIDYGPSPAEQEVLTVPIRSAVQPSLYSYVSAAPGLFATETTSTGVASAPVEALPQATSAPAEAATAPAPAATSEPASVATPAPAATQAPASAQTATISETTPLISTGFDERSGGKSPWLPLSGDWATNDGVYSQRSLEGYDYMSMLDVPQQTDYGIEAKLRVSEGTMGGGFVYNAPSNSQRNGAQSIDITDKGAFLRWGRYDDNGNYIYEGGAPIDPPIKQGDWHTLQLTTHGGSSSVSLDNQPLGTIANTSTSGYVGLTTSQAKVDFDDIRLFTLAPDGSIPAKQPTSAPPSEPATNITQFGDDFADGDAKGWQVMSGAWQVIDGTYQQIGTTGFDLGSISAFQSDTFTATIRLKRLDGDMGAGLYFNMGQRDSKNRSQMINYTQAGKAIQWGHFDEGGNFVFEGSAPVPDGGDDGWHTLGVDVQDGKATFIVDGQQVAADVALTYTKGYVGLLTSASKVAFDDVQIAAR